MSEQRFEPGQRVRMTETEAALDMLERMAKRVVKERDALRDMLHWCSDYPWQGCDIPGDGFQDEMVKRGLWVSVPADEAFRREYGADEMYVVAWSPLARAPSKSPAESDVRRRGVRQMICAECNRAIPRIDDGWRHAKFCSQWAPKPINAEAP